MDSSPARLCVGGCGFFGTVENRWFCSKCDSLNVKNMVEFDAAMGNRLSKLRLKTINVKGNGGDGDDDDDDVTMNPRVVKKNRCRLCNSKVGLLGFQCTCGLTFCGTHRYPEEHFCRFDFKKAGESIINKENPLCKADKLTHRI